MNSSAYKNISHTFDGLKANMQNEIANIDVTFYIVEKKVDFSVFLQYFIIAIIVWLLDVVVRENLKNFI